MRSLLLASCVVGFLGAAPPAPATVDAVVDRHVAALGGLARIHAITSFVHRGWYHEGDLRIATYLAQRRPFYRVIGTPARTLTSIHEGYDGSAWEYYPDPGIVVRTVGAAAAATRHGAAFDDPLVEYRLHGTTLALGDATSFEGKQVVELDVTLADGFRQKLFVDTTSWMIAGDERVVPMHAFGERYVTHNVLTDYRPEGGVMAAHHFAEIDSATGKVLDESGIDTVEINSELPLAQFSPPQWDRTPLQTMVQRIYDERDDAVPVLATYRDFGATFDVHDSKVGDAVDFVGYQCLKMGHADVSVALLARNVADHPGSARAHFGLGRALEAGGDRLRAREEYGRALAIDPQYGRARTALDALR